MLIHSGGRTVSVAPSPQATLREVVSDVSRALEDANWRNLSSDPNATERGPLHEDRQAHLNLVRTFRRKNPLARRAVGLLQTYTLGQGTSWKAENRSVVARLVDEFRDNTSNKAVLTSHAAEKWFLDRCYTDGEFFLVLFPDEQAGTVELGYIDAMWVDDVVNDPENSLIPLWYKVTRPRTKFDLASGSYVPDDRGGEETVYYRDWRNTQPKPGKMKLMNGLVYHVMPERMGKRGVSGLETAMDWLRSHQKFVGNRVTINNAAAEVAWKKKRKGDATDVEAEVNRMRSRLTTQIAAWDSNPTGPAGKTIVENEGSSLEWVNTNTGAAAAGADEKIIRMMVGSGLGGIPNHYFGDEANANLATATSMELPLLKTYEEWQAFYRSVLIDVVDFMLQTANNAGRVPDRDDESRYTDRTTTQQVAAGLADQGGGDTAAPTGGTVAEAFAPPSAPPPPQANTLAAGVKLVMVPRDPSGSPAQIGAGGTRKVSWYVDIDFPPIVQKDVQQFMLALAQFKGMLPSENIESQKLITELGLIALGDNDIDQTMSRLYPDDMIAMLVPNAPPQPPQLMPGPGNRTSLAEVRVSRLLALAAHVDDGALGD